MKNCSDKEQKIPASIGNTRSVDKSVVQQIYINSMTEQSTVQISEKESGAEDLQVSHGPSGSVLSHWESDDSCHFLNIPDNLGETALRIARRKIYSTEFLAAVENKNKEVVKSFLDRTDCNKTRFVTCEVIQDSIF